MLFKSDEPDMQDSAGEAGTSSSVMYSYGSPHMAGQKQGYPFLWHDMMMISFNAKVIFLEEQ